MTDVINGFQREVDVAERSERSQTVVRFIRKKLGKYHGIKTRFGFGYYFEEVNETAEILLAILNTTKMVDLDGRWLPIDGKPKIIDNLYGCDEGLSRVIFRIVDEIQPDGSIMKVEKYDVRIIEKDGRSLSAMVTVFVEAFKELKAENTELKERMEILEKQ